MTRTIYTAIVVKAIGLSARDDRDDTAPLKLRPYGAIQICLLLLSHARTVVRECCKGDDESQWERGKFDPPPPKNPLTDGHQNLCR